MNEELIYKFVDKENKKQYLLLEINSKIINIIKDLDDNEIDCYDEEDVDLYNVDYGILSRLEYCEPVYINMNAHIKLWELIGDLYPVGELNEYENEIKKYILFCKINKIKYKNLKENSIGNIKNIYLIMSIN